ncbi:ICE-like protease (caspase) p20 domain protein [Ceratobasidium sp. AG-Ba]|nr:ICE-like protease (caspase) p20 domain protein [Ceratobasidium sp. AG-Ba]
MSEATQATQRGPGDQNPIAALEASAVSIGEIVAYICKAISDGSRLGTASATPAPASKYRALIVAPVYKNHPGWSELESTAHDVMLVHKMLGKSIRWGYEAKNIRVLCDVCGGYYGTNYPTRENILSSLQWLTENTRKGDSRFLHFSGHGDRILQEKDTSQAKQARRVMTGGYSFPGDYERYVPTREPVEQFPFAYHESRLSVKSAIITRYDPTGVAGSEIEASQIMDKELNELLSNLPPGSHLTCIMDCCASGRMLYNNTKLRGGGFRGRMSTNAMATEQPPLDALIFSAPISNVIAESTQEAPASPIAVVLQTAKRTFSGVLFPPKTVMTEDIPQRERQMDHIQARTFVWTGCHQRQESTVFEKYNSGLLTRVFTDTFDVHFDEIKAKQMSYDTLFGQVSKKVNAQAFTTGSLQFVQLWTSIQNTNEYQVDVLLQSPVAL